MKNRNTFWVIIPFFLVAFNKINAEINQFSSANHKYSNVLFFGDSITDSATNNRLKRYIPGGYASKGYYDILSETLAGKFLTSSSFGGNNFAVSGAQSAAYKSTRNQIVDSLNRNNGQADKNALYLIWVGSNDLINIVPRYLFEKFIKNQDNNNFEVRSVDGINRPLEIAYQVKLLADAGAESIVVMNLFNPTVIPLFYQFYIRAIGGIFEAINLHQGKQIVRFFMGAPLDLLARKLALDANGSGMDYIHDTGKKILHILFLFIPNFIIDFGYDSADNVLSSINRQYNLSLKTYLEQDQANVIFLDIEKLIDEIVDNPRIYGIDNIVLTTCNMRVSSGECEKDSLNYFTDKTYLFGDWLHPSVETHAIIADYALATIFAPLYIYSIANQFENSITTTENYLNSHFYLNNMLDGATNRIEFFGAYSGQTNQNKQFLIGNRTHNNMLNLGVKYLLHPNLVLGALLSFEKNKPTPYNAISFNYNNQNIFLFSQWHPKEYFWLNMQVFGGHFKATNVVRNVRLGSFVRRELAGSTSGSAFGFNLFAKLNIVPVDFSFQSGPLSGIKYSRFHINKLTEQDNNSTSMAFSNYKYSKYSIDLGWYFNTVNFKIKDKLVNGYLNLVYEIPFDKKIKIASRTKRIQTNFMQTVKDKGKKSFKLNMGVETEWLQSVKTNLSIGYQQKKSKDKQLFYSLGFSKQF